MISAFVGCIDCVAFFEDSKSNIMRSYLRLKKMLALARFERVFVETKISKAYTLSCELAGSGTFCVHLTWNYLQAKFFEESLGSTIFPV